MSRALAIGAAAIALALAVAGCGGGGSSNGSAQDNYVKANTSVLKDLPPYPKAKLKTTATTAYTTGANSVAGYQTRYTYDLPTSATVPAVEAFYLKSLQPNWKQVASLTGPVLNYRKGDSFISVNLTQVPQHRLEVVVDNAFYSHLPKG
jgi:hypothetical protein